MSLLQGIPAKMASMNSTSAIQFRITNIPMQRFPMMSCYTEIPSYFSSNTTVLRSLQTTEQVLMFQSSLEDGKPAPKYRTLYNNLVQVYPSNLHCEKPSGILLHLSRILYRILHQFIIE